MYPICVIQSASYTVDSVVDITFHAFFLKMIIFFDCSLHVMHVLSTQLDSSAPSFLGIVGIDVEVLN